jgi:endonuclease/exonuclease/phosphatase family metal-dependent hydrolase
MYRPPSTTVTDFADEFDILLEICHESPIPFFMCGDFNIPWNQQNPSTHKFQDLLKSWCLSQHVDLPTHIQGNTLDLIISQSEQNAVTNVKSCGILSHHFCISALLNFDAIAPSKDKK